MSDVIREQHAVCSEHDAPWVEAPDDLKAGVARNVGSGLTPINGLRHLPEGGTSGWYIWAGEEFSEAPDFFDEAFVEELASNHAKSG